MDGLLVGMLDATIESGKAGKVSSPEEVSNVMWLVGFAPCLRW
jgi:hypothetical protein